MSDSQTLDAVGSSAGTSLVPLAHTLEFPLPNLDPLTLTDHESPSLPKDWQNLSESEKSTKIMEAILEVQTQNLQFKKDLLATNSKVNYHSQVIARHESELSRISAEHSDHLDAFLDRNPTAELIVNGVPKDLNLTCVEIASKIFNFIGLESKFVDNFLLGARLVKPKNPEITKISVIIEMVSDKACEKVLAVAAQKRKTVKFSLNNIFGIQNDSLLYLSKMLPPYFHNLAFHARQAKKRLGWKSVGTHGSNITVKINDQSPQITVTTMAQLQAITNK